MCTHPYKKIFALPEPARNPKKVVGKNRTQIRYLVLQVDNYLHNRSPENFLRYPNQHKSPKSQKTYITRQTQQEI